MGKGVIPAWMKAVGWVAPGVIGGVAVAMDGLSIL